MPPLRAYTSLCTVQLRQRVVKLAGPCPLLNACFTALCTHRFSRPLARLLTWSLVHMAPRPLLLLILQVTLVLQARPMVLPEGHNAAPALEPIVQALVALEATEVNNQKRNKDSKRSFRG